MCLGDAVAPEIPDDVFECAILLRRNILDLTTKGGSEQEYKLARVKLMQDGTSKRHLPEFVRHSPDADSLKMALSNVASGEGAWVLRRDHVEEPCKPFLSFLERAEVLRTRQSPPAFPDMTCRRCRSFGRRLWNGGQRTRTVR
ncbi:hypothetical protein JSE7799_00168 [Jannaschia seosinensis]|uniref:Uncharacterized protein n=1 Tax=Jannaschia seosinensis TaxID=313367 RepID=A0A0M7B7Z4_9RHOB|nr:hypothetical protein JSE7799_00168 [Jannaschia seosinensis]